METLFQHKDISVAFLVSIVIPVYNGAAFLREAIDSALSQSYPNIEVIVVNDGSTDGGATEQIALSYGEKIRYFFKQNGGVATALNVAIVQMKGDYFSWLSHDDLYVPEKIETQLRIMAAQPAPERAVIFGDFATFTADPEVCCEIRLGDVPPERFRYYLACGESVHGCTLLIPRAAFSACGVFDEELRTTQDYDMWYRLASHCSFVHVDRVLVKARQHEAQGTNQMKPLALKECNELLVRFIHDLDVEEVTRATGRTAGVAYAQVALTYSHRGFHKAAIEASKCALHHISDDGVVNFGKSLQLLTRAAFIRGRMSLRSCRKRIGRGGGAI